MQVTLPKHLTFQIIITIIIIIFRKRAGLGIAKGEEKMKGIILSGAKLHQLIKVEL